MTWDEDNSEVKLAVAETKIDHLTELLEAIRDDLKEYNKRITSLERWRAWLLGAAAVAGAALGAVFDWLRK